MDFISYMGYEAVLFFLWWESIGIFHIILSNYSEMSSVEFFDMNLHVYEILTLTRNWLNKVESV